MITVMFNTELGNKIFRYFEELHVHEKGNRYMESYSYIIAYMNKCGYKCDIHREESSKHSWVDITSSFGVTFKDEEELMLLKLMV